MAILRGGRRKRLSTGWRRRWEEVEVAGGGYEGGLSGIRFPLCSSSSSSPSISPLPLLPIPRSSRVRGRRRASVRCPPLYRYFMADCFIALHAMMDYKLFHGKKGAAIDGTDLRCVALKEATRA